tara:strand:- start:548 stop:967 length:420 start_codon:yes stop_codon:yes gene_type:complete
MSERNFWTLIRNNLPLTMYRVENKVAQGMPDVHYIKDGFSGWIELKYIDKWPKKRFVSGLRLHQVFWATKYIFNKGSSWILIRVGRDFTILVSGRHAKALFDRPSRKHLIEICSWSRQGNLSTEDWEDLAKTICLFHKI